jgi:hypothetical protein
MAEYNYRTLALKINPSARAYLKSRTLAPGERHQDVLLEMLEWAVTYEDLAGAGGVLEQQVVYFSEDAHKRVLEILDVLPGRTETERMTTAIDSFIRVHPASGS